MNTVEVDPHSDSLHNGVAKQTNVMAFCSGQYYMNFINTLKLFTANIKSFDMKSN